MAGFPSIDDIVTVQTPGGGGSVMQAKGTVAAISADGQWAGILAPDGSLRIAATASGALAAILPGPPPSLQHAWSLSSRGVAYVTRDRHRVQWWDSSTGSIRVLIDDAVQFTEALVSADGGVAWLVGELDGQDRLQLRNLNACIQFLPMTLAE